MPRPSPITCPNQVIAHIWTSGNAAVHWLSGLLRASNRRYARIATNSHGLLIAFCREHLPIAQSQRNLRLGHGVGIGATRSAVVAGGQRAAHGQRGISLCEAVAGILGPLARRLGEALGRLRQLPEDLGGICEVVFPVISKGGKLPVYARRIEAEEARESGRRPGDSVGQGRLVKALADSERAPSVVLRTVTG